MAKQKNHTKGFKLEALELARTNTKTDSQLEQELGISRGSLYHWWKELEQLC